MLDPKQSQADILRAHVLGMPADSELIALQMSETLVNSINDVINEAKVTVGVSLLTRALLARSIIAVASDWWADVAKAPTQETHKALMGIVTDPPARFDAIITNTETGSER
jgi:hypothetical protein